MRFQYSETLQFWKIGQRLFHSRFLRFMSGPKNQGQVCSGFTNRGEYEPEHSTINFAVPSLKVLNKSDTDSPHLLPGIITDLINVIAKLDKNNTYKIAVDGKKICKGRGTIMGDVDLFENETPKLSDRNLAFKLEIDDVSRAANEYSSLGV